MRKTNPTSPGWATNEIQMANHLNFNPTDQITPTMKTNRLNHPSRRLSHWLVLLLGLATSAAFAAPKSATLQISVYCTAGEARNHLSTPEGRQKVLQTITPLHVSRIFLEGRRGDEYVAPEQLREIHGFFTAHGIHCSGGIATVPGNEFAPRQTGGLDWLNWESPKTQAGVTEFFKENAPVFDELIVDDFYCTGDVSSESDRARNGRDWGTYRRDLLVSLIEPMMVQPTRAANRRTKLILKFPQWYDRFHFFGYDPVQMPKFFDSVWVGTEVRDPQTQRMGYVQPTEGYMNFRWISSVVGKKVRGAWFDHIECSAQNFVDQAYQSVLAGAQELTLFNLGNLMAAHPGDALLAERLPDLQQLASRMRGQARRGIAYYKPPDSESSENLYLADYLGMIGLPILPVGEYPRKAKVAFLPVQAAADTQLLIKMRRHLKNGATLILTPALVKALGLEAATLSGVEGLPHDAGLLADQFQIGAATATAQRPVDLGARLQSTDSAVLITAKVGDQTQPFLTRRAVSKGQVFVLNVRTFSTEDFGKTGEWLLSPQLLGLPVIPQNLADALRTNFLAPLGIKFRAPAGVSLVLAGQEACVYSFLDQPAEIQFQDASIKVPAHGWAWLE